MNGHDEYVPTTGEVQRAWVMRQFTLDTEAGREPDPAVYDREFIAWLTAHESKVRGAQLPGSARPDSAHLVGEPTTTPRPVRRRSPMSKPSSPEALYRAQCRRDGRAPHHFCDLLPQTQEKYRDAATSGRTPRLENWHGDHTDLVHVIWGHDIKGEAAVALAADIRSSVYADARRAHDQLGILKRLEALIAGGADPDDAIETLKNDLIGEDQ